MTNINFKHLRYFWAVAKEGGISRASDLLNVTPQTISGQLKLLEQNLGVNLFWKSGRRLELTEAGQKAFSYAEKIFELESELEIALLAPSTNKTTSFRVGIVDAIPKLIAYQMLEPVFALSDSLQLVCREGDIDSLLADLALHKLDLVLTNSPVPSNLRLNLFNHLLGECGTVFFAVKELAERYRADFPASLTGAPI